MDKAAKEPCTGLLVGGPGSCLLVCGAGSYPSGGRAMLGKTLCGLTLDGLGCVPALLVVWPECPSTGAYRLLGGCRSWWEMEVSRRAHANDYSPQLLLPLLLSLQGAIATSCLCRRPSRTSR